MRSNKYTVIATTVISQLTLLVCCALHTTQNIHLLFIYDVSLACFGSSIVGLIIAGLSYGAERRDTLEQIWAETDKIFTSNKTNSSDRCNNTSDSY